MNSDWVTRFCALVVLVSLVILVRDFIKSLQMYSRGYGVKITHAYRLIIINKYTIPSKATKGNRALLIVSMLLTLFVILTAGLGVFLIFLV